ncbi:uncharacterized protein LOC143152579 [Ptiloglossa arizonensis]|uniref:uncharacterized protein LOC143152579 n=1 Tax=Ptiloglossa arizonensis TaxID=3350558 RepID=UPI003FA0549D
MLNRHYKRMIRVTYIFKFHRLSNESIFQGIKLEANRRNEKIKGIDNEERNKRISLRCVPRHGSGVLGPPNCERKSRHRETRIVTAYQPADKVIMQETRLPCLALLITTGEAVLRKSPTKWKSP